MRTKSEVQKASHACNHRQGSDSCIYGLDPMVTCVCDNLSSRGCPERDHNALASQQVLSHIGEDLIVLVSVENQGIVA